MIFLPVEPQPRLQCEGILERIVREEGLTVLGWRDTPIDGSAIGRVARVSQPYIQQIFVGRAKGMTEDQFERKLYVVRKRAEAEIAASDIEDKDFFYIPSLSGRTIVYKGLLLAPQIANFYPELSDPEVVQRAVPGAPALLHQHVSDLAAGAPVPLHRPQRRNQHPARQRQLDARAPVGARVAAVRRRHQEAVPHHPARRQRFRGVRQRARTAAHGGPLDPARHGHADSRSLGQEPAHEPAEAGVLRVPRLPDGAVGRPGRHRLHRRPLHRRHARPQRPAPGALPGDPRRPRDHGVGNRRAAGEARGREAQGPPAAGQDAPGRYGRRPHRLRQGAQGPALRPQPYQLWLKENQITLDNLADPPREHQHRPGHPAAPAARLRLHRRRPQDDPRPHGREGRGAHRLHGHRHAARLSLRQAAAAVQLLQAAFRAGDQPAHRSRSAKRW